jgi:hypothetical protein
MLLNLCGEYIDEDFEKYKFEWKDRMFPYSRESVTYAVASKELNIYFLHRN